MIKWIVAGIIIILAAYLLATNFSIFEQKSVAEGRTGEEQAYGILDQELNEATAEITTEDIESAMVS